MAERKFSELPSAASLTGNELAALSQMQSGSLASVKSTLQAIANWFAVYAQYTTALQTTDKSIAGAINELKQLISLIPQFSIEVVEELPTEDISDTTIYLVPAEDPEVGNYYEEYIHVNNTWELVGTTAVDLSAYYTKLEVDGLLADKLEADDFEANQTASANPITFETKQAGLAKSCVVEMNPIQDLHGYDYPWVGGAGKNKCPNLTPYSGHGLTITVSNYGEIVVNGTPDTSVPLYIDLPTLSSGDYTISANNNTTIAQSNTYIECLDANDTQIGVTIYNSINAHFSVNGVPAKIKLNFDPRATFTDFILKIQLESGSTATSFAPYSNICPISGRTEASVTRTAGEDVETKTHQYSETIYGGVDDFVNGELDNEYELFEPTIVTTVAQSSGLWYWAFSLPKTSTNPLSTNGLMSSHFNPTNQVLAIGNCYITANGTLLLCVPADQTLNTGTLVNEWLSENDLQFAYKPATATKSQLSPEAVTLLKGLNVISTDGDKVQVEFSDIPVGDYSVLLDYIKSLEARIAAVEP